MRFTIILILLVHSLRADARGPVIPLDTLGDGPKWQLMLSEDAPEEARTLELFHGRRKQWVVTRGTNNRVKTGEKAPEGPFRGYGIISEISPPGADKDPSRRIYNLPELIDRLQPEGKLPSGVEVMAESQGSLSIIVTKPAVFAASYSLGRKVRIINRSSLVVIVVLPELLEVFQQKPEGSQQEVKTQIYSARCIPVYGTPETSLERFTMDGYYLGSASDGRQCENFPQSQFKGGLRPWMPQMLVSAKIRGQSIAQTVHYWKHFINPGI